MDGVGHRQAIGKTFPDADWTARLNNARHLCEIVEKKPLIHEEAQFFCFFNNVTAAVEIEAIGKQKSTSQLMAKRLGWKVRQH